MPASIASHHSQGSLLVSLKRQPTCLSHSAAAYRHSNSKKQPDFRKDQREIDRFCKGSHLCKTAQNISSVSLRALRCHKHHIGLTSVISLSRNYAPASSPHPKQKRKKASSPWYWRNEQLSHNLIRMVIIQLRFLGLNKKHLPCC